MKKSLSVCLIGSTGAVGSHVLRLLKEEISIDKIITLTRRPLEQLQKHENHVINFDQISDLKTRVNADIYICCLGTTIKSAGSEEAFKKVDFSYVVEFGKLAEAAHAKKLIVISSVGADTNSKIFYSRIKGEMELSIKKLNITCIEILQPSLLLGQRAEFRLGETIANYFLPLLNPLFFGSMKKYSAIKIEDVAKAIVVRSLSNDTGIKTFSSDQVQKLVQF